MNWTIKIKIDRENHISYRLLGDMIQLKLAALMTTGDIQCQNFMAQFKYKIAE